MRPHFLARSFCIVLVCLLSCKGDESSLNKQPASLPKFDDLAVVSVSISPYIDVVSRAAMSRPYPIYNKEEFLPEIQPRQPYVTGSLPMGGNLLYLSHYIDGLMNVFNDVLPGNVIAPEVVREDPVVRQLPSLSWIPNELDLIPYKMYRLEDSVYAGMLRRSIRVDALARAHFRFFAVLVDRDLSRYRIGVELLVEMWPDIGKPVLWHWLNVSDVKDIPGEFPRPVSFEDGVVGDAAQQALDRVVAEIKGLKR